MSVTGVKTGYTVPIGGNNVDLGTVYTSKDYLIDVYPNLIPGRTSPGLFAWGINGSGQLGLGDTTDRSSPVQVGSLTNWAQVSAGVTHGAGITSNGSLWAWGFNNTGQLGLGDVVSRSSPVQVGGGASWKQISVGNNCSFAIKTDGSLWAWGGNSAGVLGFGDVVNRSSPVQVGSLTNWKQISTASQTTTAIKTDGSLWSWGNNSNGQLGLGDISSRSSPVQVGSLTNWKQVACGYGGYVMAIKTDGSLWSWGNNTLGQLGVGDVTSRSSPVQVGSLTNWKQVACDNANSFTATTAIKTDGTLWAWGYNANGQLGIGDTISRSSPVQVGSLTNWKKISVAYQSTIAIKTDGTLWAWGYDLKGQLGLGDVVYRSSPVQVGSLTKWKQVVMGSNSVLAIADGYM